ncbi:flagellar hook-length control protein FliK [Microterricola gilva]|uniref:Flagellar hook-length control protein FliK n=1 Tax=Microterricola gilva TaxID=393267 RepID=A0A4Q8ANH9_9MICO|nr:flagellar hook-length control protein FliK [Microterricola gilva]RZU65535.1 flagellar hook-length control protein FliK [Microterricola gilva]
MAILTAPARPATASSGPASTDRGAGFGAALAAAGSEAAPAEAPGTAPAELDVPASGSGIDDSGAEPQLGGDALAAAPSPVDTMRPTPVTPGWGAFAGLAWTTSAVGNPAAAASDAAGPAITSESLDAAAAAGPATAVTASAVATAAPATRGRDAGTVLQAPATAPMPASTHGAATVAEGAQPVAAPLGYAPFAAAQPAPAAQARPEAAVPAAATASRLGAAPGAVPVAAATAVDEPVQADVRQSALPSAVAPQGAQSAIAGAPPVAAAEGAGRPAATSQHPPLATQLGRPLLTLAHAGDGSHSITVTVAPDRLGPVTVQAVVTGDQLRVELFAPTDHARDAVRGVLSELRRDLAATGIHATLGLSADDAPGRQGQGGQNQGGQSQTGQNPSGQNQNGQNAALGERSGQSGREARPGEHAAAAQPGTRPGTDSVQPAESAVPTSLGSASAHPHIDLIA